MKFSLPSFALWRSGALAAFTRFPWNILCGAIGAACLITLIHTEHNEWLEGQCVRLAMAAAIGMPLFFSVRIVRERIPKFTPWPIEIVGLFVLAGWFFAQPASPLRLPGIIWIQWLLLLAALHCVAAVSAHFSPSENLGFWQFNRCLFIRFCLATLYTVVLTAGLELAMLSADKLFQLKLGKEYGDLFFLMVGLFHPTFFLTGVPRDFAALDVESDYPRGLKAFTQFALAPLVAVYTAILYAYAIKIIIIRSWPHGWVALPVLLLSGIGILAFLLLSPLRSRPEEKWARWFTTNFPRALAPLSVLLLISVLIRAREYGITEARYIGIVAALWTFAWAIVFILHRRAGIRWIPSSLAIIAVLCAFGPWSAGEISKISQVKRLKHMLQAHGMWKDDHAQAPGGTVELSKAEETNLRSTLNYIIATHGGPTIKLIFEPSVLYRDWQKLIAWEAAGDIITALNIVAQEESPRLILVRRKPDSFLDVQDFRRLWRINLYASNPTWNPKRSEGVAVGIEQGALKLTTGGDNAREEISLQRIFDRIQSSRGHQLPDEDLTIDFQNGTRTFRIVFESLTVRRETNGLSLNSTELYLLQK